MRYTHPRPQRAGTAISVCLFRAATVLSVCLSWLALFPTVSHGQTLSLTNPNDVLTIDPAAFAQWLQTGRPAPVSAEEKTRILSSLPPSGEVTDLDVVQLTKLAALRRLLHTVDRDSVYVVKVIDVPQAAIGLHARAVVLISETALSLLSTDELQALAAHELAHEYVWDDYARAVQAGDRDRTKNLELVCDAIAIVTLHQSGMDSSRVISGVEKISQFNRDRFGTAVNERNYPTVAERRAFARRIQTWLMRRSPVTAHQTDRTTSGGSSAPSSHSASLRPLRADGLDRAEAAPQVRQLRDGHPSAREYAERECRDRYREEPRRCDPVSREAKSATSTRNTAASAAQSPRRTFAGVGPHASIQQTQRYLNVTDEELRRGLEVSWKNEGRPLRLASGS